MSRLILLIVALAVGFYRYYDRKSKSEAEASKGITVLVEEKKIPGKDPIKDAIYAEQIKIRSLYNARKFAELDATAKNLRATKAVYENGSWKIAQFYSAFECQKSEPESMWQLHDKIHHDWIAAHSGSITAHVSYADFLVSYAWKARGNGFINTVSDEGLRLMEERLEAAAEVLEAAKKIPEKDPVFYRVMLLIALGQGWEKPAYDALTNEAVTFEPKFWGYDTTRANSLLPRWYGEPGDWEAYADLAAKRPGGLGAEVYARIVISLNGYYGHVFRETKASWPKTRAGLELMVNKHPNAIEIQIHAVELAALARDQELAKAMLKRMGDNYFTAGWSSRSRAAEIRAWALADEIKK